MEQHLRQIRDKIIIDGYKANKKIPKPLVAQALSPEISIPSLYRILDDKIIKAHISQMEVIERGIKK